MADDPVSRLQFARDEIDRVFGRGYASENPDVVAAVMMAASTDFMALTIARAITDAATVLAEGDDAEASQSLWHPSSSLTRR
jgi:hypothetical protein